MFHHDAIIMLAVRSVKGNRLDIARHHDTLRIVASFHANLARLHPLFARCNLVRCLPYLQLRYSGPLWRSTMRKHVTCSLWKLAERRRLHGGRLPCTRSGVLVL